MEDPQMCARRRGLAMGRKRKTRNINVDGGVDDNPRSKLTKVSRNTLSPNPLLKEPRVRKQPKTLVLELDGTLVCSATESFDHNDLIIPVFGDKIVIYYVRQRPFLQMFLDRVTKMFEVIVFTACTRAYASSLLDVLDADHKIISKQMYRGSCLLLDGKYVKDLSMLGIDLANVAVVDNSHVYQLQVDNSIPIKSFHGDLSDRALVELLPFLETLVDADDVRPLIANKFGNKT